MAAGQAIVLATDVGRTALVDQWERAALAFGQDVDDGKYAQFQTFARSGPVYGLAMALIYGPVITLAVASLVFVLFRGGRDRAVSYSQVLSVMSHAGVILAIRQIVAAPISYLRETTASATSLVVWFPALDAASAVGRFVGAFDLFVLWWVVLLAVGVAVLYERRVRPLAVTFLGVYAGVALLLAATMTVLGGTT
jgi:hypothetical protein